MNYFEYFSEIEERFLARRGSLLMLSPLDWALIETWREAGVPLAAVLRGIDDAFDKHDAKAARSPARTRKVNGLAWCAQAVMLATEAQVDASTGIAPQPKEGARESGFEATRVREFLLHNATLIEIAALPAGAAETQANGVHRLRELAAGLEAAKMDELDRTLTLLEERLVTALNAAAPEADILALREAADRELTPLRARINVAQLRQVREQLLLKRLLAHYGLPRLSLFYMEHR